MLNTKIFWFLILLLLLFALVLHQLATVHGIGLSADSVNYLKGARALLAGQPGDLSTHFPPLYSMLIAAASLFGEDLLTTTRWLHTLLFLLLIASVVWVIFHAGRRDRNLALLAGLLVPFSKDLFLVNLMAWSEPFFLITTLLGLYLLARYLATGRYRFLVFSGILFGLGAVDRYAGVAMILAGGMCLLFYRPRWTTRLLDTAWFGCLALLPLAAWIIRNHLAGLSATNREWIFHPMTREKLQAGLVTIGHWFRLDENLAWLGLLIVLALLVAYVFTRFRGLAPPPDKDGAAEVFLVACMAYVVVLLLSLTFFDAYIPLSGRILAPLFLCFMLGLFLWVAQLKAQGILPRSLYVGFLLLASGLAMFHLGTVQTVTAATIRHGLGLASPSWTHSALMKVAVQLPETLPLYSNMPDAIFVHLNRHARMLPRWQDPVKRRPNQRFEDEMARLATQIRDGKVYIVYFYSGSWRTYLPDPRYLLEKQRLPVAAVVKDGFLLGVQHP